MRDFSPPGLDVPASISEALDRRGNIPVAGTIQGKRFRLTLVPLGGARHRLYVKGEMRKAAGVGVGDHVSISVRYDPEPRELPVPAELTAALIKDPTALARWDGWPLLHCREVLAYLNSLKKPETLKRNVEKVLSRLLRDA